MAPNPSQGSWLLAEELLERGDSAFVEELRNISDPERLGSFAAKWFADQRATSRKLLLEYLARPLNAFRHEALVKRLYKLAENAGDDELLAAFLIAFDRLIRRVKKTRYRYDWETRESWSEERISAARNDTMPREQRQLRYRTPVGKKLAAPTEEKQDLMRLFKPCTRRYLRRRVWRYFRTVGKVDPQRYLRAIVPALVKYTDDDVRDGLALLDKWGLVHALFHDCSAIVAKSAGWDLAAEHTLNDLVPAPLFSTAWQSSPGPLIRLLQHAQCRVVRQWAIQMLQKHHPQGLASLPLSELLVLIAHADPDVARLASEGLMASPQLGLLSIDQWLVLLEQANPQTLEVLCVVMLKRLDGGALSLAQVTKLACSRPLPVARLGFKWLQQKKPATAAECESLLALAEADAEPVRGEAIGWLQKVLGASPHFQVRWILDLLDSRHRDVRGGAWQWFLGERRASQDPSLWQRLLETPYDDVRLPLLEHLDRTVREPAIAFDRSQLKPELVRLLWATVLLNIHRGHRHKPQVVRQIVSRLEHRPEEVAELLPILSVALRSIRGPEFRAGLAGVVGAVERTPQLAAVVASTFPELQLY